MAIRWFISAVDTEKLSFENGNWKLLSLVLCAYPSTTAREPVLNAENSKHLFASLRMTNTNIQPSAHFTDLSSGSGNPASVVAAERVAFGAVDGAPAVGHFAASFPQLGEEFVAHAVFQNFYWATFETLGAEADGAMD